MSDWRATPSSQFRDLEREQRRLASEATSQATRDIHLEFAERYRQRAEELEQEEHRRSAAGSSADPD